MGICKIGSGGAEITARERLGRGDYQRAPNNLGLRSNVRRLESCRGYLGVYVTQVLAFAKNKL